MGRRASTSSTSTTAPREGHASLGSPAGGARAMTPVDQILQQAIAAHRNGALDDATRLYEQVLRVDPNSEAACGNLAILAAQRGDLAGAERLFRRETELQPNDARAFNNL